jgi:hypothetical protein
VSADPQEDREHDTADREGVHRLAAATVAELLAWRDLGVRDEVLLALLDHAEPLADRTRLAALTRQEYRTHGYAVVALLLTQGDRSAGDLATELIELLEG